MIFQSPREAMTSAVNTFVTMRFVWGKCDSDLWNFGESKSN